MVGRAEVVAGPRLPPRRSGQSRRRSCPRLPAPVLPLVVVGRLQLAAAVVEQAHLGHPRRLQSRPGSAQVQEVRSRHLLLDHRHLLAAHAPPSPQTSYADAPRTTTRVAVDAIGLLEEAIPAHGSARRRGSGSCGGAGLGGRRRARCLAPRLQPVV